MTLFQELSLPSYNLTFVSKKVCYDHFVMTTLLCCSCNLTYLFAKAPIWKPQSLSYKTYLAHVQG